MPKGPVSKTNALRPKSGRWAEKGRRDTPPGVDGGNSDRYGKGARPFAKGETDYDARPTRKK